MREPVVVIGCARSGTSMTAGIFVRHGCWVGTCREPDRYNAKGYFENTAIKAALLKRWGYLKQAMQVAEPEPGWKGTVKHLTGLQGYKGGPWLVKHGALYWRAWHEFEPTFVCVYRDPEAIMESDKRGSFSITPEAIALIRDEMDGVCEAGGFRVDSERVVDGDYSQIEPAFEDAGLEFDPAIADDFVDPDLWHH